MNSKAHWILAYAITAVWILVYTADVFSKEFSAPPEVSGVLLTVVTALFGPAILERFRQPPPPPEPPPVRKEIASAENEA